MARPEDDAASSSDPAALRRSVRWGARQPFPGHSCRDDRRHRARLTPKCGLAYL